jgi:2-polyprenyl-3-methyl-5-hydroxy-6-metoxy-1,4-benzoquinol methylase
MKTIDNKVLEGYNKGIELNRLHEGLGLIEFERTKELLLEYLPTAPAIIYDIGGGYGEYSVWLSSLGYEVHLFDISPKNIEMSGELQKRSGVKIHSASVSDARSISREDCSADAILLMGPLYHIVEKDERLLALNECRRLLKPDGVLFCAAITPYATMLWAVTTYDKNGLLDESEFTEMLKTEIATGNHIPNESSKYRGIGRSFFHNPDVLKDELSAGGFTNNDVRGVIGPCWLIPNLDEAWKTPEKRESIMRIVRMCDKENGILGLSTHLLSISQKEYQY